MDEETRRLILRLQSEDLASIWSSSTTAANDGTESDADMALRVYRQELRAADQLIEDRRLARSIAQDEIRSREVVRSDGRIASSNSCAIETDTTLMNRLASGHQQPTTFGDHHGEAVQPAPLTTSSSTLSTNSASLAPLPVDSFSVPVVKMEQALDRPIVRLPHSAPEPQIEDVVHVSTGKKRSADHLEDISASNPKKHASEALEPGVQARSRIVSFSEQRRLRNLAISKVTASKIGQTPNNRNNPISRPFSLKRPADEDKDLTSLPDAKRQLIQQRTSAGAAQENKPRVTDVWGWPVPTHSPGSTPTTAQSIAAKSTLPRASYSSVPNTVSTRTVVAKGSVFGMPSRVTTSPASKFVSNAITGTAGSPNATDKRTGVFSLEPKMSFGTSKVECLACGDAYPRNKILRTTCDHDHCHKCITRLFKKALRDETLWPPRCCKPEMSLERVFSFLPVDLVTRVKARKIEMNTPVLERIYCAACSTFIPGGNVHGTSAACSGCWTSTCTECRQKSHEGSCQNADQQSKQELDELAKEQGWKKCEKCQLWVEHNTGCNHMM